jgi:DDE superfamily endonuclease
MYLNTLQAFRHDVYACLQRAADALFEVSDALLTDPSAHSLVELSLAPSFQRRWPSLYEAFEDGRIDQQALERVFARSAPLPAVGERMWVGIDASSIERPESRTARDRSVVYVPNLPESSKPISYGWQFSTLVVLPPQPSSWTYVLAQTRIESSQSAIEVAAAQVRRLLPHLPSRPIVTSDRWYACAPFLRATADLACDKLLRVKSNRVFYRPAPPKTGKRGAPCKDGARFQCSDPSTHGQPDEQWQGTDEQGHRIEVACWKGLHLRQARQIEVTLIRVIRHHASDKPRDPRESWFLWTGEECIALEQVCPGYKRRYSQEHGYRFDKQALLWSKPRLRSPEQFERWSQVVAIVHNQLVLAREFGQAHLRPWESASRVPTPQQVRRAMARILEQLGTPAKAPKPRGKSAGRAKGTKIRLAPRYAVVRKTKSKAKKRHKSA